MNNYNDEQTRFNTPGANISSPYRSNVPGPAKQRKANSNNNMGKNIAIGAGAGLLIGGIATVAMAMAPAGEATPAGDGGNNTSSNPAWADGDIKVAHSVNDNMSFDEAFAVARAECGPGAAFEWHGQVYGTYYENEWNSMTAEQRAEFGDHFSWSHLDRSGSQVASHSTHANSHHDAAAYVDDDDVAVVSVDDDDNDDFDGNNGYEGPDDAGDEFAMVEEPEIEILGVTHDAESGMNIGSLTVDGQEVVLIDVDDNMVFDYLAVDENGNQLVDENELIDISEHGLTVDNLGGFTEDPALDPAMGNDDMMASDDSDFMIDDCYEG